MPSFSVYDTGAHLGLCQRDGMQSDGASGGSGTIGRLWPVLIGLGAVLQALPASSEPAVCQSLPRVAQQMCGVVAAIPKASDTPSPGDGDSERVVAPLSADAFHAIPADRIEADPGAFLRQPIAVGPAQCFYFKVGDYRCVVTGASPLVVAAPIVIPQESQVTVEQGCGQSSSGTTKLCNYQIMFVPVSTSRAEPNQGSVVVLRTANIMAVAKDAASSGTEEQP